VGERVQLSLHHDRRATIRANHTATHLLNHALREAMGDEVNQKGSLVAPDRLRFDFSAAHAMSMEQIARVEQRVNDAIGANLAVHAAVMPLEQARAIHGVRAVFGERYPDPVRVVSIGASAEELAADPGNPRWRGFSIEFCGGTHLASTGEARKFILLQEQALAAGVRRVTALTGAAALAADEAGARLVFRAENAGRLADDLLAAEFADIQKLVEELTISATARHRVLGRLEGLRGRVKSLRRQGQAGARDRAVEQARQLAEHAAGNLMIEVIDASDKDSLMAALDVIRARRPEAAAMLFSSDEEEAKVLIAATVPKSIIARGLKAGEWVKHVAAVCGGSGGGKPDTAMAGGKDPAKIGAAQRAAHDFASEKIS